MRGGRRVTLLLKGAGEAPTENETVQYLTSLARTGKISKTFKAHTKAVLAVDTDAGAIISSSGTSSAHVLPAL